MGSRGRMPPPYMRVSHPAHGMIHAEPFGGPPMRPPPGAFSPLDMLPPTEVLEQKAHAQHIEMEKLATENQRLAATHGTLRQQLAAIQQDLNMLEARTESVKAEREQQKRGLVNKTSKLEAELREAESIKLVLQQAHKEAQSLVKEREQLFSKVQQMGQDLQEARADLQQVPALMAELDGLRQEYQHCRATFDYEKKLYNDHLETLQVMEKNYMTMAQEVENLRAELNNTANIERKAGTSYGVGAAGYGVGGGAAGYGGGAAAAAVYGDNDSYRHPTVGKNAYGSSYSVPQGHAPQNANPIASDRSTPTYGYGTSQPGQGSVRPGYDVPPRVRGYDPQQGPMPAYDAQGGVAFNPHRGPTYGVQRPPTFDAQRAATNYGVATAASYQAQASGAGPPPGPGS
ncbi:FLX-like 2-like protein [Drosera capensis]